MDDYPVQELPHKEWPPLMDEMRDTPKRLFLRGILPDPLLYRYLCIVGARTYTPYGKEACERLIHGLAGRAIAVVSGLALGIDTVAHQAALEAGLPTVAVLGSGTQDSDIYPQSNLSLAYNILDAGGALLSEYQTGGSPGTWSFPRRNRIMAGISSATLVIEGGAKSGTLITARLAMEYNRDVMSVPGPIFSAHCEGSNRLLREGAILITSPDDILDALGMTTDSKTRPLFDVETLSANEKKILTALQTPQTIDDIVRIVDLPTHTVGALISGLEIKGVITRRTGMIERVM